MGAEITPQLPDTTQVDCHVVIPDDDRVSYRLDDENGQLLPHGFALPLDGWRGGDPTDMFYPMLRIHMSAADPGDTIADGYGHVDVTISPRCVVEITTTCEAATFVDTYARETIEISYGSGGSISAAELSAGPVTVSVPSGTLPVTITDIEAGRWEDLEVPIEACPPAPSDDPRPGPEVGKPSVAPDAGY